MYKESNKNKNEKEGNLLKKYVHNYKDKLTIYTKRRIMDDTIGRMHENYPDKKIMLPIVAGYIFQSWKDICHFKSKANYCEMMTVSGGKLMVTKPLKWIEELLEDTSFYRIHKGYLINIYHIEQYHKIGDGQIVMKSGVTIPVSRMIKSDLCLLINCS